MAEKKENNANFNKKDLNNYFNLIKKYIFKLLELDTKLYFFIAPGIALIIGLLPVAPIYIYILGIYISLSAIILTYKLDKKMKQGMSHFCF